MRRPRLFARSSKPVIPAIFDLLSGETLWSPEHRKVLSLRLPLGAGASVVWAAIVVMGQNCSRQAGAGLGLAQGWPAVG